VRERLQTEANDLMLVGHLPYLSRLVATLLGIERDRTLVEFRMGGVVRLGRNESGQWTLLWALIPDLLPALAPKREAAYCSPQVTVRIASGREQCGKGHVAPVEFRRVKPLRYQDATPKQDDTEERYEKKCWPHERCGIRVLGLFSLVGHGFAV
jgi:hypothetical protein